MCRLPLCRLPLCRLPLRAGQGEFVQHVQGRGVLIERVEVEAGGSGVQGCVGEVNGGADPDPGAFGVGIGGREAFDEFRGRFHAGQFAEPGEPAEAGERHDARE